MKKSLVFEMIGNGKPIRMNEQAACMKDAGPELNITSLELQVALAR